MLISRHLSSLVARFKAAGGVSDCLVSFSLASFLSRVFLVFPLVSSFVHNTNNTIQFHMVACLSFPTRETGINRFIVCLSYDLSPYLLLKAIFYDTRYSTRAEI
jgi:hypothetical protein